MVKNPPAMRETWIRSLGWEDTMQKEMATHSSILAWRIPVDIAWWASVHGVAKSWTTNTSWGHPGDVPGDLVKGPLLFIYFIWRIITLIILRWFLPYINMNRP